MTLGIINPRKYKLNMHGERERLDKTPLNDYDSFDDTDESEYDPEDLVEAKLHEMK